MSSKEIELFTALNYFTGVVYKLTRVHFLFKLVAVVGKCATCHSYTPYVTVLFLLEKKKSCVDMYSEHVCVKVLCITGTALLKNSTK